MKNNIISEIYEKNISYLRKCNIYDFRNKLWYIILQFFYFFVLAIRLLLRKGFVIFVKLL